MSLIDGNHLLTYIYLCALHCIYLYTCCIQEALVLYLLACGGLEIAPLSYRIIQLYIVVVVDNYTHCKLDTKSAFCARAKKKDEKI